MVPVAFLLINQVLMKAWVPALASEFWCTFEFFKHKGDLARLPFMARELILSPAYN